MTYKNEMVLPKNAVAMNSEDMMLVEGGFNPLPWILSTIAGGILYDICKPWLVKLKNTLTTRDKGWHTLKKGGKTYKAYWDGKKFTQLKRA